MEKYLLYIILPIKAFSQAHLSTNKLYTKYFQFGTSILN